ncbi:hypothetical protein [Cysteiniphilum marinum]|uniref:hypothetical protein n=1 Tax=Cysteiniphilum marinum TaxID=2774191 RepID=UPI0019399D86|nr:hypothetical protein [Cysteiniphilum marinum]
MSNEVVEIVEDKPEVKGTPKPEVKSETVAKPTNNQRISKSNKPIKPSKTGKSGHLARNHSNQKGTQESLVERALTDDNIKLIRQVQANVLKESGVSPSKMKILNAALSAEVLEKVTQEMIEKYK